MEDALEVNLTGAARAREWVAYLLRGVDPRPGWTHRHGCVPSAHAHEGCTHACCDDLDCPATTCHVVLRRHHGAVSYDWRHHPAWRGERLAELQRRAFTSSTSRRGWHRDRREERWRRFVDRRRR